MSTPSLMLVGIKRHRDQPPLKALVYGSVNAPPSPTLERIKKKRKVSEAQPGMFMFAETMDANGWLATQKGERTAELQKRINQLAESTSGEASQPDVGVSPDAQTVDQVQRQRVYRILPRRKSAALKRTGTSTPRDMTSTAPSTIPEETEMVLPFKYLEAELVPVLEVGLVDEKVAGKHVGEKTEVETLTPQHMADVEDREMDMFNVMVERFLKLNGDLEPQKPLKRPGRPSVASQRVSTPSPSANSETAAPLTAKEALDKAIAERGSKPPAEEEYVYDLFYFSREKAAEIQMMQMVNEGQVASLTGMSAVFDETEEYTSEEEDDSEVDEDSNDENYYQNDYPEEREEEGDWSESDDDLERRQRIEDGLYSTENGWEDEEEELQGPEISGARAAIFDRFGRRQRDESSEDAEEEY